MWALIKPLLSFEPVSAFLLPVLLEIFVQECWGYGAEHFGSAKQGLKGHMIFCHSKRKATVNRNIQTQGLPTHYCPLTGSDSSGFQAGFFPNPTWRFQGMKLGLHQICYH